MMDLPRLNNLTDLAEFLKTLPANDDASAEHGFDMRNEFLDDTYDHPCGSACCIGGWVKECNPETRFGSLSAAVASLGCSQDEAFKLCWAAAPDRTDFDEAWYATPQQAARAVEILRDTGFTDWPRAMQEVPA